MNRYKFAYTGRDTVNQAMKVLDALAPKIIKQVTGQVDQIAQRRIKQIINQGGQQVEKIALKIIKGAIEEVYTTPFRLLSRFGKNQLHSISRKIEKVFRI